MGKDTYTLNEYFTKCLGENRYLITTRHGSWCILDRKEYELLNEHDLDSDRCLFDKLKHTGIILSSDNIGSVIKDLALMFREYDPHNFTCIINLTNRCNLYCAYCLVDSHPGIDEKDMTEEQMQSLIRFINGSPWVNVDIEFQGGESLLRFDLIKKFVEAIESNLDKRKKIGRFIIVTNLTSMTGEIADYLMSKNFRIGSSLDGPKELHDLQRASGDGSGSYDQVISAGNYLKSRGIHVGFTATITKKSLELGSRKIIDEYVRRGMEFILFRPIIATGRGANNRNLFMDPIDFFKFWKEGIDYMAELEEKGIHIFEKKLQYMLKNIYSPSREFMCMRRPCGAAISQMSFMSDGSIYACDSGKRIDALKIGNYINGNYADVLMNSLQLRAMSSEAQPLCDTCVYTAYCGTCMSRTFSNWSDSIARTPKDFDCKVHRLMFTYIFEKMSDPKYMKMFKRWISAKKNKHYTACTGD